MADSSAQMPGAFEEVPFPFACISVDGRIEAHNSAFADYVGSDQHQGVALDQLFQLTDEKQSLTELIGDCLWRNTPRLLSVEVAALDRAAKLMITPVRAQSKIFVQIVPDSGAQRDEMEAAAASDIASRETVDFLSGLSHHLRTPVNGVLGIADLLAETKLSKQQATYVDILSRSCNALVHLVDEIQSITLLEQGAMQLERDDVDVGALASRSLDQFATSAAQKEISAKLVLADDVPKVLQVDRMKLEQVLFILLDNAFRYTDQGTITLSVDHETAEDGTQQLAFQVVDTGIGIAKERLPSLFTGVTYGEQTSAASYGNTGLGLILCHKLVELMGGTISVQSRFGWGSRFTVTVPVAAGVGQSDRLVESESAPRAWAEGRAAGLAVDSPHWKILIAEDNPVNQLLFKSILERFGHRVTIVSNGQEAVAKVQLGVPFDIILMDISMPVMDGLEATAMIRSLYGDVGSTPILALTAHAMEGDREKFINAGMDGYQSKPVDPMALQKAIADVINNHAEQAQLDKAIDANAAPTVQELSERQVSELMSSRRSRE